MNKELYKFYPDLKLTSDDWSKIASIDLLSEDELRQFNRERFMERGDSRWCPRNRYKNMLQNEEGENKKYDFLLLTVKPYTEQQISQSLEKNPLDIHSNEKVYSASNNSSKDYQGAVIKNARIFKDKITHVLGPGMGIDVLLALFFGANRVTYYDINPAHNLLTRWNVRYSQTTGQIPLGSEALQVNDIVDADVYLFNAPAVYNKAFLSFHLELHRKEFSYATRSYWMSLDEFIELFNKFKKRLADNKNALALWRIMINENFDSVDFPPGANYAMRVKAFLKKNNLEGDPVEGVRQITKDRTLSPNIYLFHSANDRTVEPGFPGRDGKKKIDFSTKTDKGGIDLNPRNTALRTGGDDVRIRFSAYRGSLPDGSIPGLDPVIMDMQPVTNLAVLIGQNGAAAALPVSSPP